MIARIPIVDVSPVVDCGRYPAKAVVGETISVEATVFREGHDPVCAGVVLTDSGGRVRPLVRMRAKGSEFPDRYVVDVTPDNQGSWSFRIEAWADPYATWAQVAALKMPAGVDVELMLHEGALVLDRAAATLPPEVTGPRQELLRAAGAARDGELTPARRLAALREPVVVSTLGRWPLREQVSAEGPFEVYVERERALYGSWYEFFPRSEGAVVGGTPTHGTFATAAERLPAIADMGFDVVYLPPIHPIGLTHRKGPNNAQVPGSADPGSPWAIGSSEGGHDAIHPDLGTIEDFDTFVADARALGLEVALDLALQCAPDHPWLTTHPEWFTERADGSIAYAENPPKKYQDIYPLNFDRDFDGLAAAVLSLVQYWLGHGVRVFRVDNPHTKPVCFWEWLLAEVRRSDPDAIFLAEAFTRPAMMRTLGMVGFQQSYTYFTWRNTKAELESYLVELAHGTSDVMRPNLFVNTPDILTDYLQSGGPPAFAIRAAIAATASPSWGVYSGFELYENAPVQPGSEEYLDSEKYQFRPRDWDEAERHGRTLAPYLRHLNEIRRRHPALQRLRNLTVHATDHDDVLCYSKHTVTGATGDTVIVVVNLDPHSPRETVVHLDLPELGLDWHTAFTVTDELSGSTWQWTAHNYVRLDPAESPAHILSVKPT